jgi:putative ABC transport system permease protein
MNDLRFAARSLLKAPTFSGAVIATLALGIGASCAIFSVADRVLFRPPPYPAPEQLVVIGHTAKDFGFLPSVYPIQLAAYREHVRSFSAFAAMRLSQANLVAGDQPVGVNTGAVPVDYLAQVGVVPLIGRTFVPGEDKAGADNVVILSHRLWKERFGGDKDAIDRQVLIDGVSCRIVGVLPPDFLPPHFHHAELYRPLTLTVDPARPLEGYLWVIGRLRPGVTLEQAQAEMATVKYDVNARAARVLANQTPSLRRLADESSTVEFRKTQWTLLAAVAFLYAIACANAANLMLARVHGRRRELSVRLAIGCSRGELVRLVAVEALVLTLVAAAVGLLVARWLFPLLLWMTRGADGDWPTAATLDWRSIAFTTALSVVTGLLICVPTAWRLSRADVIAGLKDGGAALGESRPVRRLRGALVILEAALAVVLLIGAQLMVRSVARLQHVERGIDPANKAALYLANTSRHRRSLEATRQFHENVCAALLKVPGVVAVSTATMVPLSNGSTLTRLKKPDGTEFWASWNGVAPSFRAMLGLPLVKGRWFDDAQPSSAPVVVINETMARDLFGTADPVGKSYDFRGGKDGVPWTVIGVVRDIRNRAREEAGPQFYFPDWQMPSAGGNSVLLRLSRPVDPALNDAVRRAVYTVDPLVATMALRPLSDTVALQTGSERQTLGVLKLLSGLALGLATLGLFAVMAYNVAQRMAEFGVRAALGAQPRDLMQLVMVRGARLAGLGVVLGCAGAWALTRFVLSLLYETNPHDPFVYAGVALVLVAAALIGCWLPARRAARVDVSTLLRSE